MIKHCTTSDNFEWKKILEKIKNLDVKIFVNETANLSGGECCIETTKKKMAEINAIIESTKIFTKFQHVPEWREMQYNNGPFLRDETKCWLNSTLVHSSNKSSYNPSPEEEYPLQLYVRYLMNRNEPDQLFKKNFWGDLKRILKTDIFQHLDDLDCSDISLKLKTSPENIDVAAYSTVIIDGTEYPIHPYIIQNELIVEGINRGKFQKMKNENVFINIHPESNKTRFTAQYVPGGQWASKWIDEINNKMIFSLIDFRIEEQELEIPEFQEREQEDEEETQDLDYGEEMKNESKEIDFETAFDEQEEREAEIERASEREEEPKKKPRGRGLKPVKEKEEIIEDPYFLNLTSDEKFLPISYILSQTDQWNIVLDCFRSRFKSVENLPKVCNAILEQVYKMVAYSNKVRSQKNQTVAESQNLMSMYISSRNFASQGI